MSIVKNAIAVLRDKKLREHPELFDATLDLLEAVNCDLDVASYSPSSDAEKVIDSFLETFNTAEDELEGDVEVEVEVDEDEDEDDLDEELIDEELIDEDEDEDEEDEDEDSPYDEDDEDEDDNEDEE